MDLQIAHGYSASASGLPCAGGGTRWPAVSCTAASPVRPEPSPAPAKISPRRKAESSGTPCARIAGSAGSRFCASNVCISSSAPALSIVGESRGDGRVQSGARRVEQDRRKGPGRRSPPAILPSCKPRSGASQNLPGASDALAIAGALIVLPYPGRAPPSGRAGPVRQSLAAGCARFSRAVVADIGDVGQVRGSVPKNTGRCRRTGSATVPARAHPPSRESASPRHQATSARLARRADAVEQVRRQTSSCGLGRAVRMRSSR